jgi:hypothetical protein
MTGQRVCWSITALWVTIAVATFFSAGSSTTTSWLLLAVAGAISSVILLVLWQDAPAMTIAKIVRRGVEGRR